MNTIKAMVVDDSAVVRQVLVGVLNDAPGIEVIAAAATRCWRWRRCASSGRT